MGKEGRPRPPQFIIEAAMKEDSSELERIQAAAKKTRQIRAAERRKKMHLTPAQRREISDELYQQNLRRAEASVEEAEETPDLLPDPAQARRDDLLPEEN